MCEKCSLCCNFSKPWGFKSNSHIKVHVDNVGSVWLANNNSSCERTRHIDIRAHFIIKGFVLDGVIDFVFAMSAHNDSDLFTKNCPSEAHKYNSEKLVWTVDKMTKGVNKTKNKKSRFNTSQNPSGRMLEGLYELRKMLDVGKA